MYSSKRRKSSRVTNETLKRSGSRILSHSKNQRQHHPEYEGIAQMTRDGNLFVKVEELEAALLEQAGSAAVQRRTEAVDQALPSPPGRAAQWASNARASIRTTPSIVRSGMEVNLGSIVAALSKDKAVQKTASGAAGAAVLGFAMKRLFKRKGR